MSMGTSCLDSALVLVERAECSQMDYLNCMLGSKCDECGVRRSLKVCVQIAKMSCERCPDFNVCRRFSIEVAELSWQ